MTLPVPPQRPVPPVREMSNAELADLIRAGDAYRGKAVFELGDRAATDDQAATLLGALTMLPVLREDRIHRVSLAWAAIIALLGGAGLARRVGPTAIVALGISASASGAMTNTTWLMWGFIGANAPGSGATLSVDCNHLVGLVLTASTPATDRQA